MSDFSLALYNSMANAGLNQYELSRMCGVHQTTISNYLRGKSEPSPSFLKKLNRVIRIDYKEDELMNDRKRENIDPQIVDQMKALRAEGKTNNQISMMLGVGRTTVYRYIGKMSMDVRKHQEQNKPCPVPEENVLRVDIPVAVEAKPIEEPDVQGCFPGYFFSPVQLKDDSSMHPSTIVEQETFTPDISSCVHPEYSEQPEPEQPKKIPGKVSFAVLSRKTREVLELQGSMCVFKTDTDTDYIELLDKNGGMLSGMLNYTDIPQLIRELQDLCKRRGIA